MRHPGGTWRILESAGSTQAELARVMNEGIDVVLAIEQVQGRGRFGRPWLSQPGDSLTYSMVFREYRNHPRPYLVGMACAVAAAQTVFARLQWPNDIVIGRKKVGCILTEIVDGYPVVGIGINLNQTTFPEAIQGIATSVHLETGQRFDPETVGYEIIDRLESLPEPNHFADLAPAWKTLDSTRGKPYLLSDGVLAEALGVGPDGELLCSVNGDARTVLAADAIFGSTN